MSQSPITQIAVCKPNKKQSPVYSTGIPPWELGHPQPFIQQLLLEDKIHGDVLDIGCGAGDNAIEIAKNGHMVWGVDLSKEAIDKAREKSEELNLDLTFILGNVLQASVLGEKFHTVIDSGLFHLLTEKERIQYVEELARVTLKGSTLLLLTYSQKVKNEEGVTGLKKSDIRQYFTKPFWKVDTIDESSFQTLTKEEGLHAWLAKICRR